MDLAQKLDRNCYFFTFFGDLSSPVISFVPNPQSTDME